MTLGEDTPGAVAVRCERLVPGDPAWLWDFHRARSMLLAPLAAAAERDPAQLPDGIDPVAALAAWEVLCTALPEALRTHVPEPVGDFSEPAERADTTESVVDRVYRQSVAERDRAARGSGLRGPDGREHIPVHLVELAVRDLDTLAALLDRLTQVLAGRLHGAALLDRIAERHPYPLGPSTASSLCGHLRILLDTLRPEPAPEDLALLRPLLVPPVRADADERAPRVLTDEQEAAYRRFARRVADVVCPGDLRESVAFAWRY
ncbi:hypothetical protein ACH4S8_31000 [Streptomyces sp. NPDC021080]|uniref:hypothetical protein n=1 Tax=Streptomyces sp. NPDC021080 TaxID=3365110 RepID=UPI0037A8106D